MGALGEADFEGRSCCAIKLPIGSSVRRGCGALVSAGALLGALGAGAVVTAGRSGAGLLGAMTGSGVRLVASSGVGAASGLGVGLVVLRRGVVALGSLTGAGLLGLLSVATFAPVSRGLGGSGFNICG